jgi:hypothetical protein
MRPESIYVHWWRQLRSPFVLPRVTSKCHECKWEKIDIDVLGCTLCGKVHACEYGTCTHVIETSDGLVCEFSGVVVYTKCFVETEYMDTLCVFGVEMQDLQQHTASGVKQIITTLLFSHRNKTVKHASLTALLTKCINNYEKRLRNNDNVMHLCMQMLTYFNTMPYMFAYVDAEHRKRVVHAVVENCCRVFHVLVKHGMSIRGNEIQRLAVGIVYLMRYGIGKKQAPEGIGKKQEETESNNIRPVACTTQSPELENLRRCLIYFHKRQRIAQKKRKRPI